MASNYENLLKEIKDKAGKDTMMRLLRQHDCEYEFDFLGFLDVYDALRKIAGKEFTIVDLGCYMSPQAYLFSDYKKYIGVDSINHLERFKPDNAIQYETTIQNFIKNNKINQYINLAETFAICSYVPDREAVREAVAYFKNILVIYPGMSTILKVNGEFKNIDDYEILKEFKK